uniref:ATP synthase complex subunit 8 n=1 Tax=Loris lydekkerianus TaxID=300163 RepID=S4UTX2_9PRIM|nr:ATP synthase subunit 8 [Loris lydekkerianus]AGM47571.1 ATP synthase subunit 8 [Loris lydekkerianus]WKD83281.1 ATP synthase F0 subunit 8 [Loris lydekkerianus lydekkerianus]WKD83307.1 ATP synthase F0 subunit 8 [Loris lydekkerianus lydekkerianus]
MPQLDTSTWFTTILSMTLTLFMLLQLKLSKFLYPLHPTQKFTKTYHQTNPWEKKWTKTYLPHSLPLQ